MIKLKNKVIVLLSILILTLSLIACNKASEDESQDLIDKHSDSFTQLELNNNENSDTLESNEFANQTEIVNHNEKYKDMYISDIEVDLDTLYATNWEQEWFDIPEDLNYMENVYQWVAYAILEYYDGNVPETFKFDLNTDIVNQETNMIYTVLVSGESVNLSILLDTYNYKIVINEVQ